MKRYTFNSNSVNTWEASEKENGMSYEKGAFAAEGDSLSTSPHRLSPVN